VGVFLSFSVYKFITLLHDSGSTHRHHSVSSSLSCILVTRLVNSRSRSHLPMSDIDQTVRNLEDCCAYCLSAPVYQSMDGKRMATKRIAVNLKQALASTDVLLVPDTDEWFHSTFLPTMCAIPVQKDLADLQNVLRQFMTEGKDMTEVQISTVAELIVAKFHPLG